MYWDCQCGAVVRYSATCQVCQPRPTIHQLSFADYYMRKVKRLQSEIIFSTAELEEDKRLGKWRFPNGPHLKILEERRKEITKMEIIYKKFKKYGGWE